jgi:hypothetical protein
VFYNTYGQQCPKRFIESQYKKLYYAEGDELSKQYALIGMYKESLREQDKLFQGNNDNSSIQDSNIISKNAYPYIFNAIRNNDIVILNECHNIPLHRTLLYTILDSFKSSEMTSIFLETLGYVSNDSEFISKNPNENYGIYTWENVYNQVAKKIKKLNINVYSYEIGASGELDTITKEKKKYIVNKNDSDWIPVEVDNYFISQLYSSDDYIQRNAEQAIHVFQKIKKNKIKKTFIYCGYSHAWKRESDMAWMLQYLLKKKVFSIDQSLLNERSEIKYENNLYTAFASKSFPFILVDKDSNLLPPTYLSSDQIKNNSEVDLIIGSPKTIYRNNRPDWLELNGDRKRYPLLSLIETKVLDNFLVIIYDFNEYTKLGENSTPMDVFQVKSNAANYDAILTPDKKYVLLVYKDAIKIIEKTIDVK